jgi:hypothetical protein
MFLTNITTEARRLWHLGRALKPDETVEVSDDTADEYEGHPHIAVSAAPPATAADTPEAQADETSNGTAGAAEAEAETAPTPAPDTPPADAAASDPPITDPHTEETNPA